MANAQLTVTVDVDPTIQTLESLGRSLRSSRDGAREDCKECGMPDMYADGLVDGLSIASDFIFKTAEALKVLRNG